jgi:pimeloyl-ACP methyl ester carboxylesterase
MHIHIHEIGEGPPVLLLHGTPSPAADWLPVAERLASRYRVLIPDLPGYGRSPRPVDASYAVVDAALAVALERCGAHRLAAIAGFSSGAYRAFEMVLRGRVEADLVIGLGALVTFDEPARVMRGQLARAIEADPAYLEGPEVRGLLRDVMLAPEWSAAHAEDVERVYRWSQLSSPAAMVAELDALVRLHDLRAELPRLAARVYLRVGELDLPCPPSVSDEIRRLVPRASMAVVPGCGHALLIEDLAGTVDAIERELAS